MALKPKYDVYLSNERNKKVMDQYDSLFSKFLSDANFWRFTSLVTLVCLVIAFFTIYYAFHLPQTELVVVSVNDIGEVSYVGKTRGISKEQYDIEENVIKNILNKFLFNTYTISKDSDYMYQCFKTNLYFLDSAKRKAYMKKINDTDPFSDVGRIKRSVRCETIIPISEKSYQVDFYVLESEISGYGEKETKMRGIFSLAKLDEEGYNSLSDEEIKINPLGIYITDYNIVEVK